jgi:hypothetical protein
MSKTNLAVILKSRGRGLDVQLGWRKQEIYTEFWWGNLLDSKYLEDQERDGRISKWILGRM